MLKKLLTLLALVFYINTNAQIITTAAGNGTGGFVGDLGQATAAELNYSYGVAVDALGNLYMADWLNNRVRMVTTSGVITTVAGNGTGGYGGDNGQATSAELNAPSGVALDAAGNLYISDQGNNRIRKVNSSGIITTVAGNGTASYSGDNGQATSAELNAPYGVAFDASGNMYIADNNNHRIREVNSSGVITTIAGNGTGAYSGDNGQATSAELYKPCSIVFDAAGNMYIADTYNYRIRMINTSGVITTVAGTGTSGYSGDLGQASAAELHYPRGVAIDATGNLYIADEGNNRIRIINTSGVINTIAGNGTSGYAGDNGQATSAELSSPTSIAFNSAGSMYIADANNNRVRMVSNVTTSINQLPHNNEQIIIYPNPNNGSFILKSDAIQNQTVQVYDVNGKLVLTQNLNGIATVDASGLNAGVYNLSVTNNISTFNKRLVIVK